MVVMNKGLKEYEKKQIKNIKLWKEKKEIKLGE